MILQSKFQIHQMAELHVQRKGTHYLWFWVLLIIVLIASAVIFYLNYDHTLATKATSVIVTE
jgi:hypothetical protein